MPYSVPESSAADILAHYRAVEATLVNHLRDREVLGFGRPSSGHEEHAGDPPAIELHIADLDDLDEAVRSGIAFLLLPGLAGPGLVSLRIRPGEGSAIDTVATAALSLTQALSGDGIATTAMTDGAEGLYLIGFAVGPVPPGAVAEHYAAALASQAPEIATTDPGDAQGRALLEPLHRGRARSIPAPYSLVPGSSGRLEVAAPLTMDEVAAVSAGMPLEIGPADLVDRLRSYGDLAAALGEATAQPA